MAFYRFLQDEKFQIDDSFWRCHINLIFDVLKENNIIATGDTIQINVDFTTHEDHFLILSASILLYDKAITIYFTSRKYPKKKGQMSHTKMESAFLKGLKHILSKKYKYIIVADRGFGNQRFANLCKTTGFDYVLRMNENLIVKIGEEQVNLKSKNKAEEFIGYVVAWKEEHRFTIAQKDGKTWYLLSGIEQKEAAKYYEKRFKIEKNYQDCKSGGYEIEKSKIRKYDRFKRMMYLTVLAHALTCIIGHIISTTYNNIKKNFIATDHLSLRLILAFLELDTRLYLSITENPLLFSSNSLLRN